MADGTWGGTLDQSVFKVVISMLIENQLIQTGFHLRDLAINDNTCESVCNAVQPWVDDHFRTQMTTSDAIVSIDVTQLGTEEGFTHTYTNQFGTSAVGSTFQLPSFLAVKIAMRRQARKRYGQGRMFWPVRAESLIDGSLLNATGVGQYQPVITALMDLFSGSVLTHDLALCNVHKAIAATSSHGPIPAKWYDVQALVLSTRLTTLRSRKIGVGV